RADPGVFDVVARHGAAYVLMHWRSHSATMADHATYDDVVAEVCAELAEQVERALAAGVAPDRLAIDPGIGFAKTAEQNWTLLRHPEGLQELGQPALLRA